MNAYIFVYDDFAQFEVILVALLMKSVGNIKTIGIKKELVTSHEGFKIMPDLTIDEIDYTDIDLLVLPGGNPEPLINNNELYNLIRNVNENKTIIAAICTGPLHLYMSGILADKKFTASLNELEMEYCSDCKIENENIVVEDNIITAKSNAYVDFAIEVGQLMNIYEDDYELIDTIYFFKYFQSNL